MSDYLEDQFKTLKAIKDVSGSSSLSSSELFKVFVEMRHDAYLIDAETDGAMDSDLFEVDADSDDDEEDKKEPVKVTFQLAGIEFSSCEDDGCELDDNGRIVDDQA